MIVHHCQCVISVKKPVVDCHSRDHSVQNHNSGSLCHCKFFPPLKAHVHWYNLFCIHVCFYFVAIYFYFTAYCRCFYSDRNSLRRMKFSVVPTAKWLTWCTLENACLENISELLSLDKRILAMRMVKCMSIKSRRWLDLQKSVIALRKFTQTSMVMTKSVSSEAQIG